MTYLLDTMVVSEATKARPSARVEAWTRTVSVADTAISVVTLAEIWRGALAAPEGHKRAAVLDWVERALPAQFDARILPVDAAVARQWGALEAMLKKRTPPAADALIAATALAHGLIVVTRNERDFAPMGVPIFNPWTS